MSFRNLFLGIVVAVGLCGSAHALGRNVNITGITGVSLTVTGSVALDTGSNVIGQVQMAQGPAGSVSLIAGSTIGLEAGANVIGQVQLAQGPAGSASIVSTATTPVFTQLNNLQPGVTIYSSVQDNAGTWEPMRKFVALPGTGVSGPSTTAYGAPMMGVLNNATSRFLYPYVNAAALADNNTNTSAAATYGGFLEVKTFGLLYDGTTWDRARGDSSTGAWVDLKGVDGSATFSLDSGSRQIVVASYTSSIWIDDTDAYSAGDALGGIINFAVGNTYTSFLIHGATLVDLASQDAHIDVYCFDGTYTPTSDDAAYDPADGELMDNYVTHLSFPSSTYETFADNSVATVHNLGAPVKLSGTGFYCQCVLGTGATPTYSTAADVQLRIEVIPQ